jgi:hypothetical protein
MGARRASCVVLVLFWLCAARSKCPAQTSAVTRAASVLFHQFETVASTRSDFLLHSDPDSKESGTIHAPSLRLPFLQMMVALRALKPTAEKDVEQAYTTILAGSGGFGGPVGLGPEPDGLGMITARACYIAVSQGREKPDVDADFAGASALSVNGVHAWTWTVPSQGGASRAATFYASEVPGGYFLIANNQQDFHAVIAALAVASSSTAAIDVPGWGTFGSYSYWATRTIPERLANMPADRNMLAGISAIRMFMDLDKQEGAVQFIGSGVNSSSPPGIFERLTSVRFQWEGAGVWQGPVNLSMEESSDYPLFVVFGLLGFMVAL